MVKGLRDFGENSNKEKRGRERLPIVEKEVKEMILIPDKRVKVRDQEISNNFSKEVKRLVNLEGKKMIMRKERKFNWLGKFSARSINLLQASKLKR